MCRKMGFTAAQQSASGGDGMTQNPNLAALSAAGVSVWLDDLSRNLLQSGRLRQLIDTRSVVGVTTNPSTFERALTHDRAYDGQIAELTAGGTDIDTAVRTAITDDVRAACDVLRPQWCATRPGQQPLGRDRTIPSAVIVHPIHATRKQPMRGSTALSHPRFDSQRRITHPGE
jgi:hypothetical protein